MKRYTYRVYYDGRPTNDDPLRSTKSDAEVEQVLSVLREHLEHYCDPNTKIEVSEIEMNELRGRSRRVTIETEQDETTVNKWLARGLGGLELYGEEVP